MYTGESKHLDAEAVERNQGELFTIETKVDATTFEVTKVIKAEASMEFFQDLQAAIGPDAVEPYLLEALSIALRNHRV